MLQEIAKSGIAAAEDRCANAQRISQRQAGQPARIKTSVTLNLVPKAKSGPFVYHDNLSLGFANAAHNDYDAVELFVADPSDELLNQIRDLQVKHGLAVSAVNSGGGVVQHGYSVTSADKNCRRDSLRYLLELVAFAGRLRAPVILGSIQGRWQSGVSEKLGLSRLKTALKLAVDVASPYEVPVLYGPLNRSESNLLNTISDAADWIRSNRLDHIKILADLFHMHMGKVDFEKEIKAAGEMIGHVHYTDSNRCAMGMGRIDPAPILKALQKIDFCGHLSAAVFPMPDADQAAKQSMDSMKSLNEPDEVEARS